VSCTWPCARPVHGLVHVPCTGSCTCHVHGRRRPCRRPVHSHVHGWCRRAVCTAHTWPCTGRVYGTAVIQSCTGRFRRQRRVYGPCTRPCTRPPCNVHTTRYDTTRVHGRVHDTSHGRVHGPYAAAQGPSTRPLTARTRPCNCRVDFPCTPYTWRCNGCVHVSPAHGPSTRPWTSRVDGPCRRPVYTAAYMALAFTWPVHGDNSE